MQEGARGRVAERTNTSPFIGVAALMHQLSAGQPLSLIDARAERAYQEGHLPGAVNLSARDLNAPLGGVRRLIGAQALEQRLIDLGVGTEPVVVYGAKGGSDAAHVWWTLHAYSHPAVQLLDGGIEAWQAAGLELSTELLRPQPPAVPFEPQLVAKRFIALGELRERLDDPELAILDTRYLGEYAGADVSARRGGHIPGAGLFPWDEALTEDWRLKPDAVLHEVLGDFFKTPEVAVYCQSGVRAAHTYAVLQHLGHLSPRLYLESWGEWGNRDDTPISGGASADTREVTS